ncbi:hypothetical protein F511_43898 [Dorcoceras hygrometricum]|uniref:Uncharacterized protein n=1 Tax=Dorcoceras hygrometricum TaxID=472368 RepID=A0A2Z7DKS4_9LAMI|nr:hypothetical protein F511_43898 [Dorcoceras hygrometricum]
MYQKQASDKTGIGFNNSEFCEGESSTQSRSAYDKFNKMSFVKADMMYNCLESVKYDNQNSPKLNENGKDAASNSQATSSLPAEQPVARNCQLVSPADQPVARDIQQASRLPAGEPADTSSRPPADVPAASNSYQQEADAQARDSNQLASADPIAANYPATQGEQQSNPIGLDLRLIDHCLNQQQVYCSGGTTSLPTEALFFNHLLLAMAASFYSNSVHVDFDSVLEMDEPGMVSMFQALVASGLQGFLGCTAVVYEEALVEFFANGRVRDGLVISSVDGVFVEISEDLFAVDF